MRIFGLDIGTTSIGFAVIDLDEKQNHGEILRLGVRIFPEARDPDGTPLNQQRRAKRTMRRQIRRRRERRRSLNELLATSGLLPKFGGPEWASAMAMDPYVLRARALDEPLSPHELGRAIYHLSKRRHFRERDLAESAEKDEDKTKPDEAEATDKREHLVAQLRASGETLGQALAKRPAHERKRGEHATRAIVLDEFARLCEAQAKHHPLLRDSMLRGALEEAIFAQRPVFWRKSTLGYCRFMPDAPLCPKGSWLSQQRRMLEKVNNLAIAGGNARPLDAEERSAILAALATQKKMSWGGVRKALEPIFKSRGESAKSLRFNLENGDHKGDNRDKGGLNGNAVEADLAHIFGAKWSAHPRKIELRSFIPDALWQADYGEVGTQRVVIRSEKDRAVRRKALADILVKEFGAMPTEAEALVKLHFQQGWEPYSTIALETFLPELERGERFGALVNSPDREKWRDANFPHRERPTGEILDRLPSPQNREEAERIATLRNPSVVRVQNEMRKVINNLIGLYGKPDKIRIELARDVAKSKREREEISAAIRKQEREREAARKELIANSIADPSREDIEKWLLRKECGGFCPYTGDAIGFDDIFRDNPRFEVEHIWPKSISLDNSFRNKTLCRKDINKDKGNRTPFEFFKGRPDEWVAVKDRLSKMSGRDGMSPGKVKRFIAETIPDNFANRQLNDTAYAARQVCASLQRLWPDIGPMAPVNVQAISGRVTAQLRRMWGLNHVLADDGEKTRDDHRHHAIDALVVACTDDVSVQKMSRWFRAEREGKHPQFPAPWRSIRKDAELAIEKIVVSHRVRKKVSGPLHKETIYGDTKREEMGKTGTYRIFVTRKPLERLSKGEIEDIADDHVRNVVRDWVAAHGGDPKKAFATFPRVNENGPEIRKVRLHSKQQLALMAPVSTGYADLGSNHHIAIYRNADGKIIHDTISLFEASRRLAKREAIVQRKREDGASFLMSLASGDTLHFPSGKDEGYWTVQGVWSAGPIVIVRVNDAKSATIKYPRASSLIREGAYKVSVDPIGRVRKASD